MLKLTHKRTSSADDGFPTLQLFILAICRIAEPIALTSIFPYSWLMVKGFQIGDPNDASFYAGILISAFALSESLTGMWWGGLSDRIGRKPVLLLGCFGTMLSLLAVGFSRSFTAALIGRVLGGMLNGNIGVIQTMVGELVKRPEHEPKAYSVMPFVWSIGTIIGPAIGGTFANPTQNLPTVFSEDSLFATFPWLLPNLICAVFMCGSMVAGYIFLEETHPDLRKDADLYAYHEIAEQTPMISTADVSADPAVDLRQESYGTFNEVEISKEEGWEVYSTGSDLPAPLTEKLDATKWLTWKVMMLVVALGVYSYHSMCYDHLLPIFLQEDKPEDILITDAGLFHIPGGLGMTTQTVGLIMSVNGIIALLIQAIIFPLAADRLGIWRLFALVTILHPIAYFILPFVSFLPDNLVLTGLYSCLTVRNLFNITAYPLILILLKQASPSPSVLGRINGLAASIGAGCRTIAPPVAGLLYGTGLDIGFTGLAWWGAGLVAMLGGAQIYFIPRDKNDTTVVKPVASCLAAAMISEEVPNDIVKVSIVDSTQDV
ncbi:hypothetical protein R6Q59_009929 [Mikania micrantha]